MYVSKIVELSNQMRGFGDILSEAMVVGKVLRSLGPKYNHVVAAIEESNDLTKLTPNELSGSFQAHEARFISQADEGDEKALQVRCEVSGIKHDD